MVADASVVDVTNELILRFGQPHPSPDDIPVERHAWSSTKGSLAPERMAEYRQIVEGRCPDCGGLLERQERCGWCRVCSAGWAYQGQQGASDGR